MTPMAERLRHARLARRRALARLRQARRRFHHVPEDEGWGDVPTPEQVLAREAVQAAWLTSTWTGLCATFLRALAFLLPPPRPQRPLRPPQRPLRPRLGA